MRVGGVETREGRIDESKVRAGPGGRKARAAGPKRADAASDSDETGLRTSVG